jgi:hypothetical protein
MHRSRSRSIKAMAALLLLLMLGACAALDASPTAPVAIKTVGVVSAVGDEFTLTRAGLTGLDNRVQSFSIEPWGIDELITGSAEAMLRQRFQVERVTYQRAAFASHEKDSAITFVNLLREDPLKTLVRSQVTPQGLDAYLVITKAKSTYGTTGRAVAGIGMINHNAVFGSYVQIYALYTIWVIDGHDFKVIEKRSAPPLNNAEILRLTGPSRMVDDALLPAANDPARNDRLKAAITELIKTSLPTTLQQLRLVDRS